MPCRIPQILFRRNATAASPFARCPSPAVSPSHGRECTGPDAAAAGWTKDSAVWLRWAASRLQGVMDFLNAQAPCFDETASASAASASCKADVTCSDAASAGCGSAVTFSGSATAADPQKVAAWPEKATAERHPATSPANRVAAVAGKATADSRKAESALEKATLLRRLGIAAIEKVKAEFEKSLADAGDVVLRHPRRHFRPR